MEKKNFNLFNLHDNQLDNTPNKLIVVTGKNIKEEISKLIKEIEAKGISRYKFSKELEKNLKISSANAQRLVYLKREWYPLVFIKYLITLTNKSKIKFQEHIEYLKSTRPPKKIMKAVKELNIELCKITGAHAADGTLHKNYISISDRHKSNVEYFKKWVENCFNIRLSEIKKVKNINQWQLSFNNKIISRYLIKFFDFPSGKKQYTTKEPEIIKNASLKYRKAFALGSLTFEAGIGIRQQIEFCVSSKKFRDSLVEILRLSNIKIKVMKNKSSEYWRFWSNKLSKEEAKKWLNFFEPKTEKWYKLYEYLYGFQGKVNTFDNARLAFMSIFPLQAASKTSIDEIIEIIRKHKEIWRYGIQDELEGMNSKWAHSLGHYLVILENANIIKTEKRRFGKKKSFGTTIRDVYIYNQNIKSWKVPYRPWFESKINYMQ